MTSMSMTSFYVIGLLCRHQHTLNHKQLVHARLRLVEAAVEFGSLALCLVVDCSSFLGGRLTLEVVAYSVLTQLMWKLRAAISLPIFHHCADGPRSIVMS